jgi:mono/diheme cytochrome c family protein
LLGDRLVETRLLVKIDEFNWWGYSYEWREDQSDADLLAANEEGYQREITTAAGTQTWHFPSRTQCLQCHTAASGRALGPETSQLDFDYEYPNGVTVNQVANMEHIELFEPGFEPGSTTLYPDPADPSVPLDQRARSYLQANCAICHRPGGESLITLDLRFSIPFSDTMLCNEPPEKGDLGATGATRLTPGDPALSTLSLRMHTLDTDFRMPRIGTTIVDETGVGVIDQWITELQVCP